MILNLVIILIIIVVLILTIVFIVRRNKNVNMYNEKENIFTVSYLTDEIQNTFNTILKTNIADLNLNKYETKKSEQNKMRLRQALKNCAYGDINSKDYVKDYIEDILQKKYKITEENISNIISFSNVSNLDIQDKFEILLYIFKKKYGFYALEKIITQYNLDSLKYDDNNNGYYEITESDILNIYENNIIELDFEDKLKILSQRIYQLYKGHSVIDEIRDMKIDGVSAGVSGLPENIIENSKEKLENILTSYNSVWIFFKGKTINLSFLGFKTQKELERVCKNIYRYNNPGQLSANKGYIANEMKDGSRVVVVRPPFSESWAFLVRKFDSVKKSSIEELINDLGNYKAIETMKWLINGCQVIGITGSQGSGKTTLLMSLIQFINQTYTLRIQELTFELNLRKLYPKRNILTFRETSTVSGQEGLDIQKKTDGSVNILGEVATAPVSSWLVQISQTASLFTMFTHHAKTSKNLIISMRNALLQAGGFSNERVAERQAAEAINFDIHMNKDINGHRYIERITEIVLEEASEYNNNSRIFSTIDILVFENGEYKFKNKFSERAKNEIYKNLTDDEKILFNDYLKKRKNCYE